MRFCFINIGKTTEKHIIDGIKIYADRMNHYFPFEITDLTVTYKNKQDAEQIKQAEATQILNQLKAGDILILLDEKGEQFTSRGFSQFIEKHCLGSGQKRALFVTGGAYGFTKEVYDRANFKVSLSKMTFPHQLVRLIFCEQIYRAFTILKGEKYHHD